MNLQEYEQLKFELADLIRSAQILSSGMDADSDCWRDLLSRLAEDRFTVVVAGRFSRGKSSLMNAVLGLDRLPTGIVPLTSVITYVRYGTSERVLLDFQDTGLRVEAELRDLADYVTERGNPGNVKRIRSAEIQLPAEILRRGLFFVDTPGLGSAILENTRTTQRFIPEIDMLIMVTGFESPLSEDEVRFLQQASGTVRDVFLVINKQDTVPPGARQEVVDYVAKRVRVLLGTSAPRLFSVSAKDGLAAKLANDAEALEESGIWELQTELVRFLADQRAQLFLSSMCDRVRARLDTISACDATDLLARLRSLSERINAGSLRQDEAALHVKEPDAVSADRAVPRLGGCEVCGSVMDDQFEFLARYQFELSARPRTREEHAEAGGFCPLHTWHYERIASPRGVCAAYPPLLARAARRLRELAKGECERPVASSSPPRCPVCKVRWATEERVIGSIVGRLAVAGDAELATVPRLCLPHLESVMERLNDPSACRRLLLVEAAWIDRIAEDMQRYAVKHDGLRRFLASSEESEAPLRALQVLAGHRNVNAVAAVRDLL